MTRPGESPWTGQCRHCPARYVTRWELEEHERGCAERPSVSSHAAVEALAEAWASVDGFLDGFLRSKADPACDDREGYYLGYIAEALELERRLHASGYTLTPIVPNAEPTEAAEGGVAENTGIATQDTERACSASVGCSAPIHPGQW